MDKTISEFRGEFRWLSNFWPARVTLDGVVYPSVENAYQAAKTTPEHRSPFLSCSAADAKKLGKTIPVRDDWDEVKTYIMGDLVTQKFAAGSELAQKLLATGARELVEGNDWDDTFWGVCRGKGQNRLGKILMARRDQLAKQVASTPMNLEAVSPSKVGDSAPGLIYTGIGSRKAPPEVLQWMREVARRLAGMGYTLRSGAADGSDSAFEAGCAAVNGSAEIWLPWKGFNGHVDTGLYPSARHSEMASTVHPAWDRLSRGPRALHSRNVGQVLGGDLATPSAFVLCWTPDGCESEATRSKDTGGTGTAISLASRQGIPVFNLANVDAKARFAQFFLAKHRVFHQDNTLPEDGQVFVFGSNLAGRHGKGSALIAKEKFGAIYGQGSGRQGQSYAIPTKDGRLGTPSLRDPAATLPLASIRQSIAEFIRYAKAHPGERFFVVRLGCDLANHKNEDIAPLFASAPINCSFPDVWKPWLGQQQHLEQHKTVKSASDVASKPKKQESAVNREQMSLFADASADHPPAPSNGQGVDGYVRVVSKRKGGVMAEPGETVIHGDRKNPVFGNRHILHDWQNIDERRAVINRHKVEDYWPDVLSKGPIYQEMQRIAENVKRGDCVAIACWCAPLPCHCDHIADGIRHLAAGDDLQAIVKRTMESEIPGARKPNRQLF